MASVTEVRSKLAQRCPCRPRSILLGPAIEPRSRLAAVIQANLYRAIGRSDGSKCSEPRQDDWIVQQARFDSLLANWSLQLSAVQWPVPLTCLGLAPALRRLRQRVLPTPCSDVRHGPARKYQGVPNSHHYTGYNLLNLPRSRCVDASVRMPRRRFGGSGGTAVEAVAEP